MAETGSAGQVVLHGYAPGAARHFAAASFSLMTSTTEGQSLVLLESMAAGCVPIAYDIRYGPDELLVDGETGFLVPGGDVSALADTIARFLSLPRQARPRARGRTRGSGSPPSATPRSSGAGSRSSRPRSRRGPAG